MAFTQGSKRRRPAESVTSRHAFQAVYFSSLSDVSTEGLQATAEETPITKASSNFKKKGKRAAPRQRQAKITNTHLKGEIDLSRDYEAHRK